MSPTAASGRTHLAHKAEHAVDLETGAILAVTLQGADVGDTTTILETILRSTLCSMSCRRSATL
jgi:transposase